MALLPGTRIGSYEVIAPLGAGGMGEVYRAHASSLCIGPGPPRALREGSASVEECGDTSFTSAIVESDIWLMRFDPKQTR
jgi:hypothetical protein